VNKKLQDILSSLPHSPGIYQFFNADWEIIYLWKSKNLKSRVNSYFSGQQKLNFAKKKMVWYICDIKYIVTNNETESLILENDLVKKYQPKYNILLKDDKNFLYIKITKGNYPKIIKTRISPSNIKKSDGKYYGPYISGYHVSQIFKILKKIFWYWVWNHNFFMKKWSYNLDKYIFSGNIKADEIETQAYYMQKISEIWKFLSWDTKSVKESITQQMHLYAKNLEFEQAQKCKISLEALESLDTNQIVRDGVKWNYYILQVLEKYDKIFIGWIHIIEGKISAYENFEIENRLWEEKSEIMQSIIEQKWAEDENKQQITFIIPEAINTIPEVISYEIPQLWPKFELLKLCYKNIYEYAHKKYIDGLSTKSFTKGNMQHILELLWYDAINNDIVFECNDISHLSGTHTVASRSVIENGKKNPKKYKKFRVKTLEQWKIDDFNSMREIMTRRIAELQKIWNYPDLVVIDGWKWQLWAVMEILEQYPEVQEKLQMVSLAKRDEELFLPWNSIPVMLERDSAELRLIQALRDEAHRFAISFNRDSRIKSQKKNVLESIPWVWPVTRKKILKHFWSVAKLSESPKEEIIEILWKSVTENLENHGLI